MKRKKGQDSRVAQGVSGPSSSCVWNPRVFADDARGWQCPFVLCLQPQGCVLPGVANVAGNPPGALQGRGKTWRRGALGFSRQEYWNGVPLPSPG